MYEQWDACVPRKWSIVLSAYHQNLKSVSLDDLIKCMISYVWSQIQQI